MPNSQPQQPPDLRDPTVVAVEVTSIKGQMALLGQQVQQAMQNVSSQLAALQGDVRDIERTVEKVATQQHELQTHSDGLARAFAAIERLSGRMDHWIDVHESENKGVSDKVNSHATGVRVVWVVFGIVATLAAALMQAKFDAVTGKIDQHVIDSQEARHRVEQHVRDNRAEIEKLKATRLAR